MRKEDLRLAAGMTTNTVSYTHLCAVCKPCPHGGLDLFAGLAGVHLVQDIQEWGKLAFSVEEIGRAHV